MYLVYVPFKLPVSVVPFSNCKGFIALTAPSTTEIKLHNQKHTYT